ncbi:FAD-binding domain-containing protein [Jaminaea rosea]|uniref:D-arabinono-1,4-lactone oxidase n=1 Tax=Jaminaea rosea TaxID=1569628 RepID=A0A316UW87_9BASI|nr:FAD-binding domain-containing protein [Jaminaea rosea]PWN29556.1 FAD-binding domain-containing protein [Jaminaea rosea]
MVSPAAPDPSTSTSVVSSPSSAAARARPPSIASHRQSTNHLESLLTSVTLSPRSRRATITNWGGSFTSRPTRVFQPTTVEQCCAILELARRSGQKVRAVGKAHSPSDLMMSDQWSIRMEGLEGTLEIDAATDENGAGLPSATFLGGTLISDINNILASHSPPLAMTSLGSISEQTIGGLLATATHGSGYHFPAVSALVQHLDVAVPLPPARGGVQVVRCSREQNADLFNATLCGIGATGIIVAVKIQVEPAFRLSHLVEEVDFNYIFGSPTGYPSIQRESYDVEGATQNQGRVPLGHLVAAGESLPPAKDRYRPRARQSSPSIIFPTESTDDEQLRRSSPAFMDDEDDEVTRQAQSRIDSIAQSCQHARIWWFPHVGMVTLSRADRTLEPAVGPTWGQRLYHSLVGYHMEQALLFAARYHPALPERVARIVHRLTHPAYPTELRAKAQGEQGEQREQREPAAAAGSAPLRPTHPHSRSVDDSWKIFNMDCLFPQYTTEWAIPYEHTAAVLRVMRDWLSAEQASRTGVRFHFPIEIRFSAPDGLWLSPTSGRRTTYIGLVQYRPYDLPVPYRVLFARFETIMRHFAGRPHWAKTHTCGAKELEGLYPHWKEWTETRAKWDPEGILSGGAYVRRHVDAAVGEDVGSRRFKRRECGKL